MQGFALTLDTDWAPDCAIDHVTQRLIAAQVKATWFITHQSPAIEKLRQFPALFELGIHPHFSEDSTHGKTTSDVIKHCLDLVPQAKSMRCHALAQSTPILQTIAETSSIQTDVSLFLPYHQHLAPTEFILNGHRLLRLPYYWEDDMEMQRPSPVWNASPLMDHCNGLRIFNFHPIHIYLNSISMGPYNQLKTVGRLQEASEVSIRAYRQSGIGTATLFEDVLKKLKAEPNHYTIQELHALWKNDPLNH